MRVHLVGSTYDSTKHSDYPLNRLLDSFHADIHKIHSLVQEPKDADIIILATNYKYPIVGQGLIKERVIRDYKNKCVLFDSSDFPSPLTGGLCASWPNSLQNAAAAVGWCFFHANSAEPRINFQPLPQDPSYLFSFVGSRQTHAIRSIIFDLYSSVTDVYLKDTSQVSLKNLRGEAVDSGFTKTTYLR